MPLINTISRVPVLLKNRTKLIRKRSAHRLRIFLNYILNKKAKEPIFIITARRTGSNLLLEYLNSVHDVSFAPEVLNKNMFYGLRGQFISKHAALRHIAYSIGYCKKNICGAKLVKVQLQHHGITLEDLKSYFPKARFIILYRRSLLDQFVSLEIAKKTNTWQWTNQFRLPDSITIKVPELTKFCGEIKQFYRDIFRHPWIKECSIALSYEELTQSPQETFERVVFPFLKLHPCQIVSSLKKQNTKKLHQIIQNYADIVPWIGHPLTHQDYSFSNHEENNSIQISRAVSQAAQRSF